MRTRLPAAPMAALTCVPLTLTATPSWADAPAASAAGEAPHEAPSDQPADAAPDDATPEGAELLDVRSIDLIGARAGGLIIDTGVTAGSAFGQAQARVGAIAS
ncbi:hypothetical protein [Kytococcus sp. Marseille-QA3725]